MNSLRLILPYSRIYHEKSAGLYCDVERRNQAYKKLNYNSGKLI